MPVTRIWDADAGVWRMVGGTVVEDDPPSGLYLPLAGGTMTGPLYLATSPITDAQAATKAYVDSVAGGGGGALPTGLISMFGGVTPPTGFLMCDGTVVSRATYATLFAVIGEAFGAGDGSTTFKLPDMRGKFPLGKAVSGTGSVLGVTGGQLGHQHNGPSHAHTMNTHLHVAPAHAHATNLPAGTTSTAAAHAHNVGDTDAQGSHAHSAGSTGGPSSTFSLNYASGSLSPDVALATHTHDAPSTSSAGSHAHNVADTDAQGAHSHTIDFGSVTSTSAGAANTTAVDPGDTNLGGTGVTTTPAGASVDPPFQAVNYIIKT